MYMVPPSNGTNQSFTTPGGVSYYSAGNPIEVGQDGVALANALGWSQAPQSLEGASSEYPRWFKVGSGLTAADFATAGLTNSINLFVLPARTVIHTIKIKHSHSFSGGAISAYTVSVGINGNLAKYATAFDVFEAVASNTLQISSNCDAEDDSSSTQILATATSVGANLSAATAGSVSIWALLSRND